MKIYEEIIYELENSTPLASNNHEAIIIDVITNNFRIKKVFVDLRSKVDVLYYKTFEDFKLEDRQLTAVRMPLVGFTSSSIKPEEMMTLMVTVGRALNAKLFQSILWFLKNLRHIIYLSVDLLSADLDFIISFGK